MSGLYLHIPFCNSKCSYCDFFSVANKSQISPFVSALIKEIEKKKSIINGKVINTIYFGGGTPSSLEISEIEKILIALYSDYNISENSEITFEANPEDLNLNYLKELKGLGINRLSIGVQSMNDNILHFLRRRHSVYDSILCFENARKAGFSNISADLIYGIPSMNINLWRETINKCLELPISHLSAYHLTIEEKTLLHKQLKQKKFSIIKDSKSLEQFKDLIEIAKNNGFELYEISNFAKPGMQSKHNSAYWTHEEYIGFGPSAHSFYDNTRSYNICDIKRYVDSVNTNQEFSEKEILTNMDLINETIMLSLRTKNGLDLMSFNQKFEDLELNGLFTKLKTINNKYYILDNNILSLTLDGLFVSDTIISQLFK